MQPTKSFPEAPVWVTVPAQTPLVLKMTLSAPGEPPVKTPLVLGTLSVYSFEITEKVASLLLVF